MQSMSVFFDITKVTDFWLENADISRNEKMCHMIYVCLLSPLGNI